MKRASLPSLRSWIGRINILKRTILPKALYGVNEIPSKISTPFFTKIDETIIKLIQKHKRPWEAKAF